MSGSQLSPRSSEQQNSFPCQPLPDFTALAHKLQEAAQALLELDHARRVAAQDPAEAESAPCAPDPEQPGAGFAIRSYRIPQFILRDEQELLKSADADDLPDVLHKVYKHFSCIAKLLQQYDEEEDLQGFELNSIGEVLSIRLDWLLRLFATFRGFEEVRKVHAE